MSIIKRIVGVIVIISLISGLLVVTYGCKQKEKKAILLIHGILGGAMYDEDTGEAVWALDLIETSELISMLSDPNEMMDQLSLDENGESLHNLRVANMDDERGKYTMLSMFEPLYTSINEEYGDDYDVIVWQYDWRLDNIQTAAKLEKFIEDNGYDKLIFITHSMGGNVVSQFLANSEENREKVELFIPFSTPFLGSADAYHFLVDGLFANVGGLLNSIPMKNGRVDFTPFYRAPIPSLINGLKPMLKGLGANLPSIYMLSPFEQYANDPVYSAEQTPVMLDGVYVSHAQAAEYFSGLDIAKKGDGSLKPGFALYESYQAGHMVMIDGELKHISNLVNTYYIAGSGVATLKSLNINSTTGALIGVEQTNYGDGVVSVFSSSAGNSMTADNVYVMNGSSHISVLTDAQCVDKAMEILADFINN